VVQVRMKRGPDVFLQPIDPERTVLPAPGPVRWPLVTEHGPGSSPARVRFSTAVGVGLVVGRDGLFRDAGVGSASRLSESAEADVFHLGELLDSGG